MKIIYTRYGEETFVDDEDYDELNKHLWTCNENGYIIRYAKVHEDRNGIVIMHREIMNAPNGMVVDHINHVRHDNQKNNLRICTNQENSMNKVLQRNNTSGATGVQKNKSKNHTSWSATIGIDKKYIYLGSFRNMADAIKTRREAEEKYFGEFRYKEHKTIEEILEGNIEKPEKIPGVSWNKKINKWVSNIRTSSGTIILGVYDTLDEAKEARLSAEVFYFGESCR